MVHTRRPRGLLPLQGRQLLTWPEDAGIDLFHSGPTMGWVRFSDAGQWMPPLQQLMEDILAQQQWLLPIAGGAFAVDTLLDWDDEALDIADARAWKLVSSLLHAPVRTEAARAVRVPVGRELPLQPHTVGEASVTMLLVGEGLHWRHESLPVEAVRLPRPMQPGDMVAHPSSMRPCVADNTAASAVCFISWDYQRLSDKAG